MPARAVGKQIQGFSAERIADSAVISGILRIIGAQKMNIVGTADSAVRIDEAVPLPRRYIGLKIKLLVGKHDKLIFLAALQKGGRILAAAVARRLFFEHGIQNDALAQRNVIAVDEICFRIVPP